MFHIQTLNKISPVGLNKFDPANYTVDAPETTPDAIMVRSASMHDMEMPESLLAIARAGAGVNNIPVADCAQKGIVVFNTPGANANAVKELVLCGMLLASRKVTRAIDWCKTIKDEGDNVPKTVEKGKSAFAGPELKGKTLAVIGLGAIGVLVANAAVALGMNVVGYDPMISVEHAWKLAQSVRHENSLDELFAACDFITVHVPMTDKTRGMIGRRALSLCKKGVRIINYARGGLVDEAALLEALADGRVAAYVISCVLFAFMHVWTFALSSWDWSYLILMLQYLVPGLVFAWAFDHSGTLWTSILLHATVNALALWAIVG